MRQNEDALFRIFLKKGAYRLDFEFLQRMNKDLKKASATLTPSECRYLVDSYYVIQDYRKRAANQIRAMEQDGEPNELTRWFLSQYELLENNIKKALDAYTDSTKLGIWLKSITGIGPVIAAGLIAHIDIEKAPTAGNIWSFAGLNPNMVWEKGQIRPWNAKLKLLCWKLGESFIKVRNRESDIYGKLYWERKLYEWDRNLKGELSEQAKTILKNKKMDKKKDSYLWYSGQLVPKLIPKAAIADMAEIFRENKNHLELCDQVEEGKGIPMLPPGHINERCKRYSVKIFISHLHEYWYWLHYKEPPPKPFAIAILGHAHKIEPPNMYNVK